MYYTTRRQRMYLVYSQWNCLSLCSPAQARASQEARIEQRNGG
jgi:hypothetical protein